MSQKGNVQETDLIPKSARGSSKEGKPKAPKAETGGNSPRIGPFPPTQKSGDPKKPGNTDGAPGSSLSRVRSKDALLATFALLTLLFLILTIVFATKGTKTETKTESSGGNGKRSTSNCNSETCLLIASHFRAVAGNKPDFCQRSFVAAVGGHGGINIRERDEERIQLSKFRKNRMKELIVAGQRLKNTRDAHFRMNTFYRSCLYHIDRASIYQLNIPQSQVKYEDHYRKNLFTTSEIKERLEVYTEKAEPQNSIFARCNEGWLRQYCQYLPHVELVRDYKDNPKNFKFSAHFKGLNKSSPVTIKMLDSAKVESAFKYIHETVLKKQKSISAQTVTKIAGQIKAKTMLLLSQDPMDVLQGSELDIRMTDTVYNKLKAVFEKEQEQLYVETMFKNYEKVKEKYSIGMHNLFKTILVQHFGDKQQLMEWHNWLSLYAFFSIEQLLDDAGELKNKDLKEREEFCMKYTSQYYSLGISRAFYQNFKPFNTAQFFGNVRNSYLETLIRIFAKWSNTENRNKAKNRLSTTMTMLAYPIEIDQLGEKEFTDKLYKGVYMLRTNFIRTMIRLQQENVKRYFETIAGDESLKQHTTWFAHAIGSLEPEFNARNIFNYLDEDVLMFQDAPVAYTYGQLAAFIADQVAQVWDSKNLKTGEMRMIKRLGRCIAEDNVQSGTLKEMCQKNSRLKIIAASCDHIINNANLQAERSSQTKFPYELFPDPESLKRKLSTTFKVNENEYNKVNYICAGLTVRCLMDENMPVGSPPSNINFNLIEDACKPINSNSIPKLFCKSGGIFYDREDKEGMKLEEKVEMQLENEIFCQGSLKNSHKTVAHLCSTIQNTTAGNYGQNTKHFSEHPVGSHFFPAMLALKFIAQLQAQNPGEDWKIPGYEHLSQRQLLITSFASNWCEKHDGKGQLYNRIMCRIGLDSVITGIPELKESQECPNVKVKKQCKLIDPVENEST